MPCRSVPVVTWLRCRPETGTRTRSGAKSTALGSVTRVIGRIPILDVEPAVDGGRRPARAVKGESFQVSATLFREGHGIINVAAVLRGPGLPSRGGLGGSSPRASTASPLAYMRELAPGTDRWGADVTVT